MVVSAQANSFAMGTGDRSFSLERRHSRKHKQMALQYQSKFTSSTVENVIVSYFKLVLKWRRLQTTTVLLKERCGRNKVEFQNQCRILSSNTRTLPLLPLPAALPNK